MEAKKKLWRVRESIAGFNFLGIGLRGGSMLGKFILLMSISKYGSLESLGVFGIFMSSVMLLNYIQGIEFHTFSAREIFSKPVEMRATIFWNQTIVHAVTYLVVLPLALFVFWGGFLSWEYVGIFYLIVVVTHIGQELQRVLMFISKTVESYVVSFLIHGLWAYIAVGNILLQGQSIDLSLIFKFWAISASFGIVVGVLLLRGQHFFNISRFNFNIKIINDGLRVCYKFFIGVLGFKLIDVSDRYFIQYFHGDSIVGVYTLFSGVANIAQELVYTGVVVLIFPVMVKSYNEGDFADYSIQKNLMKSRVIIGSVIAAILVSSSMYLLLGFLEKSVFIDNFDSFIVLLASAIIINFSLLPHYVLYAHAKDSEIMWAVIAGALLNTMLNFFLIPAFGIFGAALSTLMSVALVTTIKYRFSFGLR